MQAILDTLPPMMNALRMVWIISRHYSDDQRMGALFQRIGREIGDRVEAAVDLRQVFRMQVRRGCLQASLCQLRDSLWSHNGRGQDPCGLVRKVRNRSSSFSSSPMCTICLILRFHMYVCDCRERMQWRIPPLPAAHKASKTI